MSVFDRVERVAQRAADAVRRRANGMIRRAFVTLVDDAQDLQHVQIAALGEGEGSVEHFQPYGIFTIPYKGSEVLLFRVGGAPEHQIAAFANKRDLRPQVDGASEGDLVIYHGDTGVLIHVQASGTVKVQATAKVLVDAPEVVLGGEVATTADGVATGLAVDPFTGATFEALGHVSSKVKAVK